MAVGGAGAGLTRLVPLTPGLLAQLDALATEFPYLGLHDGVHIAPDHGQLAKLADRFPYMVAEQ